VTSTSAQQARHSDLLKHGARVGLVAYGVVHLIVAGIALQIAWSSGGDASSGGALRKLAEQPFGRTMLWITVVGLVALALWQLGTAVWGYAGEDGAKRVRKRAGAAGRVVVYVTLAVSAAKVAGGSGSGGTLALGAPAGRVLVALLAIAIIAVGVRQVHRGVTDSFTHDLEGGATSGDSGSAIIVLGRVGYAAKGVAIGVVGILFGWAALAYDPEKAGGLDDALRTVRDQPFGPYLLSAVALGLAAFGLFCFAWAKNPRTR
jgi:hypothetical protein